MASFREEYENIINWGFVDNPEDEVLTEAEEAALPTEKRSLAAIAREIAKDWKNVNYAAKPYLQAMSTLDSIDDDYGYDSGRSIVAYFLSNATSWKGDVAKKVKAELKAMLKSKK